MTYGFAGNNPWYTSRNSHGIITVGDIWRPDNRAGLAIIPCYISPSPPVQRIQYRVGNKGDVQIPGLDLGKSTQVLSSFSKKLSKRVLKTEVPDSLKDRDHRYMRSR
jgi:hypothetical protein